MTEAEKMLLEAERAILADDPHTPFLTPRQAARVAVEAARLAARLVTMRGAESEGGAVSIAWGNVKQCADYLGLQRDRMSAILDDLTAAGRVRVIGGKSVGGRVMVRRYNLRDLESALAD